MKAAKSDVRPAKKRRGGRQGAGGDLRRGEAERKRTERSDAEDRLDEALDESFPASDPPAPAHPDVTGWDADDAAERKAGGKR